MLNTKVLFFYVAVAITLVASFVNGFYKLMIAINPNF